MAELRTIAAELGAKDISTYIASGNLICTPPTDHDRFDRKLESAIEERYGFFREVISRSVDELRAALSAHPFEVENEKNSYVYFLTAAPTTDRRESFAQKDFNDDCAQVIDADLHIRYANGAGRSKLTAPTIARGLGVQGTGRNLKTVRALIELAQD